MSLIDKFENNRIFSENEGWMLFRMAAIGEACGWTMLILGILIGKYVLPGNQIPVMIAGQFHGVLFIGYAITAIGLYPTLRWSRKRALVALLASIPPYGSLLFERWAQLTRDHDTFQAYRCCIALSVLSNLE